MLIPRRVKFRKQHHPRRRGAAKGGTKTLSAVYHYAEPVKAKGFVYMDTPGYDPVAATGQVAGGANVLCFTTGRGSLVDEILTAAGLTNLAAELGIAFCAKPALREAATIAVDEPNLALVLDALGVTAQRADDDAGGYPLRP